MTLGEDATSFLSVAPKWFKGNDAAVAFLTTFHSICEVWDDLVDKDEPVSNVQISDAFTRALIELPRNPFYVQNFALLSPLMEAAIADWHTSNALEARKKGDDLRNAFSLRQVTHQLVVMCARIVGGPEWAQKVALEFINCRGSWADYAQKHGVT